MNLINKKLLIQKIQSFEFPTGEKQVLAHKLIDGWQKALKDSDLEKTKEKSVQGKFLNTFFEDILGYTDITTGQKEWTLIQHPRIENDSMEPDGSLGWFTKGQKLTRVVIELKDAMTSLDKKQSSRVGKYTPIEQAYLYATKYEGCNWIIVSNFKEIRLYNKQRTQEYYEKFEVLNLSNEEEFKRFYYLLSKDNLISKDKESDIDILAKDTSVEEQNITEKFYAEFKQIRLNLLDHLINNNPELAKDVLLEKTQKLLDRLIFTLVCEDTSSLLPLNIVINTYERAINSLSPSDERVWTEFKGLFLAIDKGNSRVKPPINAYNGGLFAFDSILDNLIIKDDIWRELIELAKYDFETDLNVNILGHIFEQSISDLESIKESIVLATENGGNLLTEDGNKIEIGTKERLIEKVGKRKKDGIFYTPEYITHYIVENTVGKYLEDHPDQLETIKILDPACGSGAFLNQTHSFLFKEHRIKYEAKISEKLEKGEGLTLFDYNPAEADRGILLNNLYGVDLNQESVDITKLALWLKTARKSEPLQSLDKNIKCGNSLIDDSSVVGDKAFSWNREFNEVMNNGGFDVIIGNPPYVSTKQIPPSERKYFWKAFGNILTSEMDLYELFMFKCLSELLKKDGYLGFITPNSFYSATSFELLRKYLLSNFELLQVLDFPYRFYPFDDANTETCIHIYKKTSPSNNITKLMTAKKEKDYSGILIGEEHELEQEKFSKIFEGKIVTKPSSILVKLLTQKHKLHDFVSTHKGWMSVPEKTIIGGNIIEQGVFNESEVKNNPKLKSITSEYIEGRDIHRYYIDDVKKFVNTTGIDKKTSKWHNQPKIVLQRIVGQNKRKIFASIDLKNKIVFPSANIINANSNDQLLTVLGILNSKLVDYFYNKFYGESNTNVTSSAIEQLPFPNIQKIDNNFFNINVKSIINGISKKTTLLEKTLSIIKAEYIFDKEPYKFTRFEHLGWNEFMEIFDANDINLSIHKKEELLVWFKSKQGELLDLQNYINSMSSKIDEEVYKLYGLTSEEIEIVEGSNK
jgi:type I restriction-modification system DNA methylase subunit